ncbi:MAG: STAS domain-containing protein [Spirochaetota bacterium]
MRTLSEAASRKDRDEKYRGELTIALEPGPSDYGSRTLQIEGQIDYYNASYFEETVADLLVPGVTRLVLSCPDLRYVSWAGIVAFLRISLILRRRGGELVLDSLYPPVLAMFRMLGVEGSFTVRPRS